MTRGAGALTTLLLLAIQAGCAPMRPGAGPGLRLAPAAGWRAEYRATARGPDAEQRFRLAWAASPPARFRLEVYGPVGGARLLVVSDGEMVLAAATRPRLQARAAADAGGMQDLLGVPLPAAGWVALLAGTLFTGGPSVRQAIPGGGEMTLLAAGEPGGGSVEVLRPGSAPAHLEVEVRRWRETPRGAAPADLVARGPAGSLRLRLRRLSLEAPAAEAFLLPSLAGFQEVDPEELERMGLRLLGGTP